MKIQQFVQITVGLLLAGAIEARFLPPITEHLPTHLVASSEGELGPSARMALAETNHHDIPHAEIANKLKKRMTNQEIERDLRQRMDRFRERLQIPPEALWGPYPNAEALSTGRWLLELFSNWALQEIKKGTPKSSRSIRVSFNQQERIRNRYLAEARNNPQPHPVPQDMGKLTMSKEEYEESLRRQRQVQVSGPRMMPDDELNLEEGNDEAGTAVSRKKVKVAKKENSQVTEDALLHGSLFATKEKEAASQQRQQSSGASAKKEELNQELPSFSISGLDPKAEEGQDDFWGTIKADWEKLKDLYEDFDFYEKQYVESRER